MMRYPAGASRSPPRAGRPGVLVTPRAWRGGPRRATPQVPSCDAALGLPASLKVGPTPTMTSGWTAKVTVSVQDKKYMRCRYQLRMVPRWDRAGAHLDNGPASMQSKISIRHSRSPDGGQVLEHTCAKEVQRCCSVCDTSQAEMALCTAVSKAGVWILSRAGTCSTTFVILVEHQHHYTQQPTFHCDEFRQQTCLTKSLRTTLACRGIYWQDGLYCTYVWADLIDVPPPPPPPST